jgi:hypothetical protein
MLIIFCRGSLGKDMTFNFYLFCFTAEMVFTNGNFFKLLDTDSFL